MFPSSSGIAFCNQPRYVGSCETHNLDLGKYQAMRAAAYSIQVVKASSDPSYKYTFYT